MKKIRIKHGHKIVAFGLAALLLFVPFSSNLGDKLNVNAEDTDPVTPDPGSPDPDNPGSDTVTTNKDVTYTIPGQFENVSVGEGENQKDYVVFSTGTEDKSPLEINVRTLSDKVNVKLNPSVMFSGVESDSRDEKIYYLEGDPFDTTINGYDKEFENKPDESPYNKAVPVTVKPTYKVTYSYKYFICKYEPDLNAYIEADPTEPISEFTLGNDKYVVYAKPEFKTIELDEEKTIISIKQEQMLDGTPRYYADDKTENINQLKVKSKIIGEGGQLEPSTEDKNTPKYIVDQNAKSAYCQMAIYSKKVDTVDLATERFDWTGTCVNDLAGVPTYKSATATGTLSFGSVDKATDIYVGSIKYTVAYSESGKPTEFKNISDGAWSDEASLTATVDGVVKDGYYYGYAGYFVDGNPITKLVDLSKIRICNVPPTITLGGLYEYTPASDGASEKWSLVSNSGGPVELLLSELSYSSDKCYRYVVTAESQVPIQAVTGYTTTPGEQYVFTELTNSDKEAFAGKTIYYYEIKYADIKDGEFRLYVAAEDKLGNKHTLNEAPERMLAPTVKKCSVEYLTLDVTGTKNGNPVDFSQTWNHTNEKIQLTVTARSRFNITKLSLMDGDKELKVAALGTENSDLTFVQKVSGGIYEAVWTFELPSIITETNYKIDKLKIVAEDQNSNNGLNKKEMTFAEFVYDVTNPVVRLDDTALSGTKWYQSYDLTGKVLSGEASVEDSLVVANYYIDVNGGDTSEATGESLLASEGLTEQNFLIPVPESKSLAGTRIRFDVKDKAGNKIADDSKMLTICVDQTNPVINKVSAYIDQGEDVNGQMTKKYPKIKVDVTDNLTIDRVDFEITYPNGKTDSRSINADISAPNQEVSVEYELPTDSNLENGKYKIKAVVYDMSGRASYPKYIEYNVDTVNPVFTAKIAEGLKDGQTYSSSSVVRVALLADDINIDPEKLVVTDNGKEVRNVSWYANMAVLAITENGPHNIVLSGTDAVGNPGREVSVSFILDNIAPVITPSLSGLMGSNGVYRGQVTVNFSLGDEANEDSNNYHWTATRTLPKQQPEEIPLTGTNFKTYPFNGDGRYHITFYATDLAGNTSEVRSVDFSIDSTLPQVNITAPDGTVTKDANVTFNIKKPMWEGLTAKATIYRKAGDGIVERQLDPIDIALTGADTNLTRSFSETGVYRVELTITDAMGNKATDTKTFTVDKKAPVIKMSGVNNYDKFDKSFDMEVQIDEEFYTTKQVIVRGTRTDIAGKVESLDYRDSIAPATNPTIVKRTFDQDGIYDITVYSKDAAGNETTNTVHFVIDKTKPEIGDLSAYDNKVFKEFSWDVDLDGLVSDLTVCDVQMYLNGSEYDGSSDIEDGAYTLLVSAVDELGHKAEKSVNFILDTKPPVFIVSGVEDGQIKNEAYNINISLQLDEDILDSVRLNGKTITISENNTAQISVSAEGKYELVMHAKDAAGNESEQTISFAFGEEKKADMNWIIAVIAGGIVIVGGFVFILFMKKRNK